MFSLLFYPEKSSSFLCFLFACLTFVLSFHFIWEVKNIFFCVNSDKSVLKKPIVTWVAEAYNLVANQKY